MRNEGGRAASRVLLLGGHSLICRRASAHPVKSGDVVYGA